VICLTLCLLSARRYHWVCCLLHCVFCVTLPYAEEVARLNAMMLSSYLEKESKMNTVCWYCDAAYVWTLLLPTYCLHTLSQVHAYTMMLGLDTPRGGKGSVTLRANTCSNKIHHIHTQFLITTTIIPIYTYTSCHSTAWHSLHHCTMKCTCSPHT
jgi:hypothetical protein